MTEIYTLQGPKRNPNHQPSPANYDNDRYTPMPDDNFNEPVINDQPIESPYPTSDGRPEFYHLKTVQDHPEPMRDDQPFQSASPPMNDPYSPIRTADGDGAGAAPELYHLGQSDDNRPIPDRRPPSEFRSNNRVSPMPYEEASPAGQERPELYYIQAGDEPRQRSPSIKKTTFNDQPIYIDNQDRNSDPDEQPGKVTLYVLKSPDGENRPPPFIAQQRTPSPPVNFIGKHLEKMFFFLSHFFRFVQRKNNNSNLPWPMMLWMMIVIKNTMFHPNDVHFQLP
jgi:hypothetical protein